jgi:hypothetical protein
VLHGNALFILVAWFCALRKMIGECARLPPGFSENFRAIQDWHVLAFE